MRGSVRSLRPTRRRALNRLERVFSDEFMLLARWEATLLWWHVAKSLDPRQRWRLRQLRAATGLRVNLGSGRTQQPGWLNVDVGRGPDITHHLGHRLPLPDSCARTVFSEHVLEHLSYPRETRVFLSEAFRLLDDGGVFRVIVPDAEKYLLAYARGDLTELRDLAGETHDNEPMQVVNRVFRERVFHRYAWDYRLLDVELKRAGFGHVRRAAFRDSADVAANIDYDQDLRRRQSLYVEARKV